MKTPITAVASSGAELPAAINVAPATSGFIRKTEIRVKYLFYKRTNKYRTVILGFQLFSTFNSSNKEFFYIRPRVALYSRKSNHITTCFVTDS